ncbi:MAG: carbamoyl-phosphate synthase large subunit [Opitutales bacterium]|nr:carbamoyl-phosphate synthase large subunit [Opitutales bacterium]
MPKRTDIESILIIGSGPIVIGQACEFDYSGTQACKALKEEGYRVVLVNSNPATIMTDPEFSDATYIEPLVPEVLEQIIAKEKPDVLLPTLGGQTGLNLSLELDKLGILEKYGVELIGAKREAIEKGEDRELFKEAMVKIGLDVARSYRVKSLDEAREAAYDLGLFPVIIRPSFTLGGAGGGIAYNKEEYEEMILRGLDMSPVHEVLVEECLLGWKEYEMEVMRDHKDQCVVICSIENFDPMGVHTGDSITVAPAMTLTDKEYQIMRDASFACIREVGVETGGSNIQFSVNPQNGRMVVIEMNPRVSRSSALASKATGFPIAKIAAKLAVGYSLDELKNDITRETPTCFEPTIDYVVTKIPRFTFEKFPGTDTTLTSSMKSVGEAMAIGRTFKESFQKALRSLETRANGFGAGGAWGDRQIKESNEIKSKLSTPSAERAFYVRYAFLAGMAIEEIHRITSIDPWFLYQLKELVEMEDHLFELKFSDLTPEIVKKAKEFGYTDTQIAHLVGTKREKVRKLREGFGIYTTYRLVDTCAAEFEAFTPYFYSSYGDENEIVKSDKKKIMILGGGPNRIGQGIEFDYCCVHASFALKELGYETIMVNSNPETVSTDYDTSDKLFFEPLTLEDVLEVYSQQECDGVIVQFGGQTPLNLANEMVGYGINILGTSHESIELAEDREHFKNVLNKINLKQPENRIARSPEEAYEMAGDIGFPVLLRPSFVLGGRGMFIVYNIEELKKVVREVFDVAPGKPVLLDKFLEDAIELDVDCISDGETVVIGGMLEHVEFAGVHSGDAAMVLPPHTLSKEMLDTVRRTTYDLAKALEIKGLMNIQYAIKDNELYMIEANPRASRTVPFVSKAIGVPLAKLAAKVMLGHTLKEMGFTQEIIPPFYSIKESVFPFVRFPNSPITLSPEMKSTGEVMGQDMNLGMAFAKAQLAAQPPLPTNGNVFISVKREHKKQAVELAKNFVDLGFTICATEGTADSIEEAGISVKRLFKLSEGARPNVVDVIKNGETSLIINAPHGMIPRKDDDAIRREALNHNICIMTTMTSAFAAVEGIRAMIENPLQVKSIQEYHELLGS